MNNFLALLSDRRHAKVLAAMKILDEAKEAGSIFNVDLVSVKESLNSALDEVKSKYQDSIDRDRLRENVPAIQEFWYWSAYVHTVPGFIKKLAKLQKTPVPELAPFIVCLNEIAVYAEIMQNLKDKVVKGRKPSEVPVVVDMTNTGTCAICGKAHKLTKAVKMVDHGFSISDGNGHYIGFRSGKCFGVGYAPYEVSNEANVAYAVAIERAMTKETATVASLTENTIESFTWHTKKYNRATGRMEQIEHVAVKGTMEHEKRRLHLIHKSQATLANLGETKKWNDTMIVKWKLSPLP